MTSRRRTVSIRIATYSQLSKRAETLGRSSSSIVEDLLDGFFHGRINLGIMRRAVPQAPKVKPSPPVERPEKPVKASQARPKPRAASEVIGERKAGTVRLW